MPGPVELSDTYKPLNDLAYRDYDIDPDEVEDVHYNRSGSAYVWRAGPDSGIASFGERVDDDYARQARDTRRRTNLVKGVMQNKGVSETEAREVAHDYLGEWRDIRDDDDLTGREKRQKWRDIRKDMIGSP